MTDQEDIAARADLISRMFAMLTARLEDAAALAADGQGRHDNAELIDAARRLISLAEDAGTVATAIDVLLTTD